ncbi:MAG: hypothetical protein IRY97_08950, partial [Thermomicrobiaceae bacterium]|nr:hypothetical protein [Thermomicrobiaceae bacterium]
MRRALALILALAALLASSVAAAAAPGASDRALPVEQGTTGPGLARHPLYLKVHGYDAHGRPLVTNPTPRGYTPQQIAAYLGLAGDGRGQTIAVVDAFDHPN